MQPARGAAAADGEFAVESNLNAGVAKIDITPTTVAGLTVVGHRREVSGVRDPLRAGVLVLDDGTTKATIVTLDVIGEEIWTRSGRYLLILRIPGVQINF